MVNSDMILFSANGASSKFFDLYSDGYFMPMDDTKNDLTGSYEIIGNEVKFKIQRKADTGDAEDYVIAGDRTINCAYAVNPFSSDRRSKHNQHNRWNFKLPVRPPLVVPTTVDSEGGTDSTADWLPPGPIAVKPEYPVNYLTIPEAVTTISNYIKSVGWTLDGASSAKQGNEKAV